MNNLFMVRFQLIRMFSYANNKLQMCSVTQHQCWRRQMRGKLSQIHPVHSLFVCYKKWLVLTEQSIHGNVSTHEDVLLCYEQTTELCSVTQHQCRRHQMWGKYSQIHLVHSLFICYKKNDFYWLNNLFMVRFKLIVCPLMLRTNYRCVQSPNISVNVAKIFTNSHTTLTLYLLQKNDLSWLNNLFMVKFKLMWMSSYAKNKLQMCSVTQHQCRRRQM